MPAKLFRLEYLRETCALSASDSILIVLGFYSAAGAIQCKHCFRRKEGRQRAAIVGGESPNQHPRISTSCPPGSPPASLATKLLHRFGRCLQAPCIEKSPLTPWSMFLLGLSRTLHPSGGSSTTSLCAEPSPCRPCASGSSDVARDLRACYGLQSLWAYVAGFGAGGEHRLQRSVDVHMYRKKEIDTNTETNTCREIATDIGLDADIDMDEDTDIDTDEDRDEDRATDRNRDIDRNKKGDEDSDKGINKDIDTDATQI